MGRFAVFMHVLVMTFYLSVPLNLQTRNVILGCRFNLCGDFVLKVRVNICATDFAISTIVERF